MSTMNLNAMHKMLNDFLINFIAQRQVVFENCADSLGVKIAGVEEEIELFVEKNLIVLISQAEVLQELMS